MKRRKKAPDAKDIKLALHKISQMGDGLKPEIIDWTNIGNKAVSLAKETLREKCIECGK